MQTNPLSYDRPLGEAIFKEIIIGNLWWEPWSSGYGRWLMLEKLWVRIPAPYTGWIWHLFTLICCKHCIVCLKRPRINEKEAGACPFKKIIGNLRISPPPHHLPPPTHTSAFSRFRKNLIGRKTIYRSADWNILTCTFALLDCVKARKTILNMHKLFL